MTYLFPFSLIPEGSRIILYGTGDVGKDFFLQLRGLRKSYELLAWTSTTLDDYELAAPFDYAKNIPSYPYDYVIIAVTGKPQADQIKDILCRLGVSEEKQIWAPHYYTMGAFQLPTNRRMMLKSLDFYLDILDERLKSESIFGGDACGNSFYQSFLELGLSGWRNSGDRIALYHLHEFLKKTDEVLDVGCNCGFFALQVAPFVKHITGYELDEHLVRVASKTKDFLKVENADFFAGDYWKKEPENGRYNAVFAFAIHHWVISGGVQPAAFVNRLYDALANDGYLFFESNRLRTGGGGDQGLYYALCDMFLKHGMECVYLQSFRTDCEREIRVFQKKTL